MGADASDSAADAARLAPTSAPPWNPSRPVPSDRPLESVARIPGRIVSLPLSVLGYLTESGLEFVEEYNVVPRVSVRIAQLRSVGLELGTAGLGDRTGWGGRVGYAPPQFSWLKASISGSTNQYNRANVALARRGTGFEYQSDWRSQDPFYGVGRGAPQSVVSSYAARIEAARIVVRWPNSPPPRDPMNMVLPDPVADFPVSVPGRHEVWAWAGARDVVLSRGRDQDPERLSLERRFPGLASQLGERIEHLVYGAHLGVDTRQGRPHWSRGWRLAAEAERFDAPIEALALRDAGTPSMQFTRITYEGEAGWSFYRDPRTLRLYVRVQDLRAFSHDGIFLVSDLSKLGGSQGLHGFEPGRFHDADLALGRLTYIMPLMRYVELDLHGELGNVFRRIEDVRFTTLEHSIGFAFRVRSPLAPVAAAGIDVSRETVRFRFAVGGVE